MKKLKAIIRKWNMKKTIFKMISQQMMMKMKTKKKELFQTIMKIMMMISKLCNNNN